MQSSNSSRASTIARHNAHLAMLLKRTDIVAQGPATRVSRVGLNPLGEVASGGAVEISTAEDSWAIFQGMRSVDVASFRGESQGARPTMTRVAASPSAGRSGSVALPASFPRGQGATVTREPNRKVGSRAKVGSRVWSEVNHTNTRRGRPITNPVALLGMCVALHH